MVWKCSLCSWFASKNLKGVLRHMGTVHAHEAGFFTRCDVQGCPRTYSKFYSYKKHVYRKHGQILDVLSGELDRSTSTSGTIAPSYIPGQSESEEESEEEVASICAKEQLREAALFVLKAKNVYKVSQSSLNGLMCDFGAALESRVHRLETKVMAAIDNADATLKMQMTEIFNSPDVANPFCGLTTEYMQKKFFEEEFHLVVGFDCRGGGYDTTMCMMCVIVHFELHFLHGSLT